MSLVAEAVLLIVALTAGALLLLFLPSREEPAEAEPERVADDE